MKRSFFLILFTCFLMSVKVFAQNENFNFNKSFHSLGFSAFQGVNFAPKLQVSIGEIKPVLFNSYVPELIFQYSCMIKNGFGVALEVPFGVFKRYSYTNLSDYGASCDVTLETGDFYVGFTGKLFVFKELSKNVCMQGELGIKFHPFYTPADQWHTTDYNVVLADWLFNPDYKPYYAKDNSTINFLTVDQKYYAIPDATTGLMFFFHSSKNPRQNLVLGITANLSFVERIRVTYNTAFSELGFNGSTHYGEGWYAWKSSSIGITVGYRFFGVK